MYRNQNLEKKATGGHENQYKGTQKVEVRNPRVDLFETEREFIVRLSLPGVKRENLEINFTHQGYLEIKGIVTTEAPMGVNKVIAQEIFQGPFYRLVRLPQSAQHQGLNFSYDNGILVIYIKKS